MSTRHAKAGSPLRQERYASSFEKGLLANLVAKRVSPLTGRALREAIWFIQELSWQPGALESAAREIKSTGAELTRLCLDPSFAPAQLLKAVILYRCRHIKNLPRHVQTEIGERISDALDYTVKFRCLTLIDGNARTGKTFAARAWCERNPGSVRFVQVPCTNDEIGFFRAVAKALGVSINLNSKSQELRQRVEETLQCGDLTIVFDEAHYLWPNLIDPRTLPTRINWLMTALVNHQVPTALIVTPQFHKTQKLIEKRTRWTSEQFTGRLGHIERLPTHLEKRNLLAVAESLLPEGSPVLWRALASYAAVNGYNLASIDANVKRARWFAEKSGRAIVNKDDVRQVFLEITGEVERQTIELSGGFRAALPPGARVDIADGIKFASEGVTAPALEET